MNKIIFDLDNTLLIWKDEYINVLIEVLNEFGIYENYEEINDIIDTYDKNCKILDKEDLLNRINNRFLVNLLASLIGLFIDYFFGFCYAIVLYKVLMVLETQMSTFKLLFNFVIVFIPFDIVKCLLASTIVKRLENSKLIEEE